MNVGTYSVNDPDCVLFVVSVELKALPAPLPGLMKICSHGLSRPSRDRDRYLIACNSTCALRGLSWPVGSLSRVC